MVQMNLKRLSTEELTQAQLNELAVHVPLDELAAYLESLEKDLQELPVHIQRVRNAIQAKQGGLSSQGKESTDAPNFATNSKLTAPVPLKRERSPMEMIRNEYKGMKLGDILESLLNSKRIPMTTRELSEIVYQVESCDEFERARNSLSAELRIGAKSKSPRWRKVGRFAYASLDSDSGGSYVNS